MIVSCKKAKNCFTDAETYEYMLSVPSERLMGFFASLGELKRNDAFRRPVFFLTLPDGVRVKGIVAEKVITVSFPSADFEETKKQFEETLDGFSL